MDRFDITIIGAGVVGPAVLLFTPEVIAFAASIIAAKRNSMRIL
jgi:hypothetical protein